MLYKLSTVCRLTAYSHSAFLRACDRQTAALRAISHAGGSVPPLALLVRCSPSLGITYGYYALLPGFLRGCSYRGLSLTVFQYPSLCPGGYGFLWEVKDSNLLRYSKCTKSSHATITPISQVWRGSTIRVA